MKEELMVEFYIYPEESENSFNPLNFKNHGKKS
jgi:hypothetical protein